MAAAGESPTKLIVNYIPETVTQATLLSLFAPIGKLESCKLIANRGYGFVEFAEPEDAAKAKRELDGLPMENKTLKVSYALLNPESKPPGEPEADWNLYMCNLPEDMTLQRLHAIFAQFGRIVNSRIAAGIAFVLFESRQEAERAIEHTNGRVPEGFSHPLVVKFANRPNPNRPRPAPPPPRAYAHAPKPPYAWCGPVAHVPHAPHLAHAHAHAHAHANPVHDRQPNNWSIYVYNLAPEVEELTLWQLFGPYGAIVGVKIVKDRQTDRSKGFGFVTMRSFDQAAAAIQELNGYALMGQPLSVSFKTHKR